MCHKIKSNRQLRANMLIILATVVIIGILLVNSNILLSRSIFIIYVVVIIRMVCLKVSYPKDYYYKVYVTDEEIIFKSWLRKQRISRNFRLFRNVVGDELVVANVCENNSKKTKEVILPYSEEIEELLKKYSFWNIYEIKTISKLWNVRKKCENASSLLRKTWIKFNILMHVCRLFYRKVVIY